MHALEWTMKIIPRRGDHERIQSFCWRIQIGSIVDEKVKHWLTVDSKYSIFQQKLLNCATFHLYTQLTLSRKDELLQKFIMEIFLGATLLLVCVYTPLWGIRKRELNFLLDLKFDCNFIWCLNFEIDILAIESCAFARGKYRILFFFLLALFVIQFLFHFVKNKFSFSSPI